ncbi:MAG: tetratricopeptide repeat protein, partial [Candidatus Eisenbacteria bacterium]
EALAARPDDATAAFNLGVALEDQRRPHAAAAAYENALAVDAEYADAHFNLGRLWERLGEPRKALRHLQAFRRLTGDLPRG